MFSVSIVGGAFGFFGERRTKGMLCLFVYLCPNRVFKQPLFELTLDFIDSTAVLSHEWAVCALGSKTRKFFAGANAIWP